MKNYAQRLYDDLKDKFGKPQFLAVEDDCCRFSVLTPFSFKSGEPLAVDVQAKVENNNDDALCCRADELPQYRSYAVDGNQISRQTTAAVIDEHTLELNGELREYVRNIMRESEDVYKKLQFCFIRCTDPNIPAKYTPLPPKLTPSAYATSWNIPLSPVEDNRPLIWQKIRELQAPEYENTGWAFEYDHVHLVKTPFMVREGEVSVYPPSGAEVGLHTIAPKSAEDVMEGWKRVWLINAHVTSTHAYNDCEPSNLGIQTFLATDVCVDTNGCLEFCILDIQENHLTRPDAFAIIPESGKPEDIERINVAVVGDCVRRYNKGLGNLAREAWERETWNYLNHKHDERERTPIWETKTCAEGVLIDGVPAAILHTGFPAKQIKGEPDAFLAVFLTRNDTSIHAVPMLEYEDGDGEVAYTPLTVEEIDDNIYQIDKLHKWLNDRDAITGINEVCTALDNAEAQLAHLTDRDGDVNVGDDDAR